MADFKKAAGYMRKKYVGPPKKGTKKVFVMRSEDKN